VSPDRVMASGSGLDPHITLKGALDPLDRVVAKWAAGAHLPESEVRERIERLLRAEATAPLGGCYGTPE